MTEEAKIPPAFPKTFDSCPNCGSQKRIVNDLFNELKAKGQASPIMKAGLMVLQTPLMDPTKPAFAVPILVSFIDACSDCGTIYVVEIKKIMATPQMNQGHGGPGGGSSGLVFGKG